MKAQTQIYNRQTTSIILEGIGVQGDLRNEHEFAEDNSTFGGGFAGFYSIDRVCAGPTKRAVLKPPGVLLKTSQPKQQHEAEVVCQANEEYPYPDHPPPSPLSSPPRRQA